MKMKTLLVGSLAVNVILVGAGIYLVQEDLGDLSSTPPLIVCVSHGRPEVAQQPAADAVPAATNDLRRSNWRRVQSEDYAQYVARLRKLGCPDKTVCDIVTADVNEMFRRRAESDVYTATRFGP